MRVISQDGRSDIPYDNFVFGMTKDNSIVAIRDTIARPSEVVNGIVAKYSTEDKAKKAMEMLRNEYLNFMAEATPDGNGFCFNPPKVFQFPMDREVVVNET